MKKLLKKSIAVIILALTISCTQQQSSRNTIDAPNCTVTKETITYGFMYKKVVWSKETFQYGQLISSTKPRETTWLPFRWGVGILIVLSFLLFLSIGEESISDEDDLPITLKNAILLHSDSLKGILYITIFIVIWQWTSDFITITTWLILPVGMILGLIVATIKAMLKKSKAINEVEVLEAEVPEAD